MSFNALQNTSDYDVYVKKYLQTLQLQVALDQKNFNENRAFMKTGVQETERPDSRSIEERAADVEKLKVQARAMLNKITDPANTSEVLDYLVKNGDLLFFFIQQFPTIEKIVAKEFAGGIRAPLLISLIFKRFTTQQEESLLPESEEFEIVSKIMTKEDAETLARETQDNMLQQMLNLAKDDLPLKADIKRVLDDPVKYIEELRLLAETYKSSPSIDDYNKMIEEYNDAPLKDASNRDLENQEAELFQIVNDFLQLTQTQSMQSQMQQSLSSQTLPGTKKYKSRSSLARTIPKAPEKRVPSTLPARSKKVQALSELKSGQPQLKRVPKKAPPPLASELRQQKSTLQPSTPVQKKPTFSELQTSRTKLQTPIPGAKPRGRPPGSKNKPKAPVVIPTAPTTTPTAPTTTTTPVIQTGSGMLNEREQDAHRFKVLKGEIGAGNKSPELVKELKRLVIKLHRGGELSLEQTAGILKELNTL